MIKRNLLFILGFSSVSVLFSQRVSVGSGSYTTTFPGADIAGRNGYPSGSPLVVDSLKSKPIPTNDWWSAKLKSAHCDNLFNYPLTMKTVNQGLVVSYIPWGVISDIQPIVMGVKDLNASSSVVSGYTDWTVTMEWKESTRRFQTTMGMGMPMLYFQKGSSDSARVLVNSGTVTVSGANLIIENAYNGADFVVYGPSGTQWIKRGTSYISGLNGKNYWSMMMLPHNSPSLKNAADTFQRYAFVEPMNTQANWQYVESTNVVNTEFEIKPRVHEGTDSMVLSGLLPHQWAHLSGANPTYTGHVFPTVRGELKLIASNRYRVSYTFTGILPTLPYVDYMSEGFNPISLQSKIEQLQNEGLSTWTDSYNEGQVMNRLIQTARVAHEMGNSEAVSAIVKTIKNRLENWLSYSSGEVAFLFYYNKTWTSLLGYPAGHGQDNNINDHHFHWGYFIHAASFLEEFEPGWSAKYGAMIDLLVRDAASPNRKDALFPYLRNFNPYAGHCWANGFATFPQGNDQESTSESMQFNSSLIHWGMITGNKAIRDLGIYLYCTEKSAIDEYWFDIQRRNFSKTQAYALVSRVWGNSYDNGTFWTNDIAASYGIELYPIHGGSFYLATDSNYVQRLWKEMAKNTGILSNQVNDNLWHDVYWKYLSFMDPSAALKLYNSYPNRNLKFGISDAQTYHWLHSLNALGRFTPSVTADYPLAMVFSKDGKKTYVAKNYGKDTLKVIFSDGFSLKVPPRKLMTSSDLGLPVRIRSDFQQYYKGSSISLRMDSLLVEPDSIRWYMNSTIISSAGSKETVLKTSKLASGRYRFYANVYYKGQVSQSNIPTILVGEQVPFETKWNAIPGMIESGRFDQFDGGNAQQVSYLDIGSVNQGNSRKEEFADVSRDSKEGLILTWIEDGEWYEYSTNVSEDGLYKCVIRYANGNTSARGKMNLELDGKTVAVANSFATTGKWETFANKEITNIPLRGGKRILRLYFEEAGINLASLTFTKTGNLPEKMPVANAGGNKSISKLVDSVRLSGSLSTPGKLGYLNYLWTQIYGPSVLAIDSKTDKEPILRGLEEGVYKIQLTVSDSLYSDNQSIYVFVGDGRNLLPEVSLIQPLATGVYIENQKIRIQASASDPDGVIQKITYWLDSDSVVSLVEPFAVYKTIPLGKHRVYAVAMDDSGARVASDSVWIEAKQLSGDWKIVPQAGALAVGADKSQLSWWSNSLADVQTRSCLFDDVYRFGTSGDFFNVLGVQTWLEGWQNGGKEGCAAPKAPHDGSNTGSWSIDSLSGELIITGTGNYLGLPKATNKGELGAGATETGVRRYSLEFQSNVLVVGINYGTGYWQFKLIPSTVSNTRDELATTQNWVLSPNPLQGEVLRISSAIPVSAVVIRDASGKRVLESKSTEINVAALKQGLYYVTIETSRGSKTKPLVVVK